MLLPREHWLGAESLGTKAGREQRRCPERVSTCWQHFVARIKDFKSSVTLLCWKHRCYWVDSQAWVALSFKEYAGLRLPLLWQLPYGRGSSCCRIHTVSLPWSCEQGKGYSQTSGSGFQVSLFLALYGRLLDALLDRGGSSVLTAHSREPQVMCFAWGNLEDM